MTDRIAIDEPTSSELNSFHQLQGLFFRLTILIYYNLKCQLYTDMNASKEFRFRVHIYHMKENHGLTSGQKSMKLILFLSKALVNAETHYWSTELKVTDLVWLVWKIHHMLKSAEKLMIIYTDHFTTLNIVQQFSLTSITFINKMNLQLVCASEYLQRFCLDVQHKANKVNIVSDTLSWLISSNTSTLNSLNQSLNDLTVNTLKINIQSWLADQTAWLKSKKDILKDS